MSHIRILGKIIGYDIETNEIVIKASFLEPNVQGVLEGFAISKKLSSIQIKENHKKTHQDHQRKCWYGSLRLILKAQGFLPNAENMYTEDMLQRDSIFPAMEFERGGKVKYRPKRMHECSFEEMQSNIEVLHTRHQHLKVYGEFIDFSNLKLK